MYKFFKKILYAILRITSDARKEIAKLTMICKEDNKQSVEKKVKLESCSYLQVKEAMI